MLRLTCILAIAIILALPMISAHAQGVTGSADIRVIDTDGNPVSDAIITISNTGTGLSRQKNTDKNGKIWAHLAPGDYEVQIDKAGYQSVVIERMSIQIGVTTPLAVPMPNDQIEEIVTYASAASLTHVAVGETGLNISLDELTQIPVARSIEAVGIDGARNNSWNSSIWR